MKKRNLKRAGFFILIVSLWTVPALISATHGYYSQSDEESRSWIFIFLKTWPYNLVWAFFTPLVIFLGSKFPLFTKQVWKRLVTHLALSFITAIAYIALISFYHSMIDGFSGGFSGYLDFLTLGLSFYLDMDVLFYWAILGISQVILFVRNRNSDDLRVAQFDINPQTFINKISVKDGKKIHVVDTRDIVSIEAANYYITIHVNGNSLLHRERMKNIEARLNPQRFLRIHKSAIINLDFLKIIQRRENGEYAVVMENEQVFNVSRRKKADLMKMQKNINLLVTSSTASP